MCDALATCHAFKLTVTGTFDLDGFQEVINRLKARGTVKNLFFSEKARKLEAVATFFVQTDASVAELTAELLAVMGVTNVILEDNDA